MSSQCAFDRAPDLEFDDYEIIEPHDTVHPSPNIENFDTDSEDEKLFAFVTDIEDGIESCVIALENTDITPSCQYTISTKGEAVNLPNLLAISADGFSDLTLYKPYFCAAVLVEAHGITAGDPAGDELRQIVALGFKVFQQMKEFWGGVDCAADRARKEYGKQHILTSVREVENIRAKSVMGHVRGLPEAGQKALHVLLTLLTVGLPNTATMLTTTTASNSTTTAKFWMSYNQDDGILPFTPACQLWALKTGPDTFFRVWACGIKPEDKLLENAPGSANFAAEVEGMIKFGAALEKWGWDCHEKGWDVDTIEESDVIDYPPSFAHVDLKMD